MISLAQLGIVTDRYDDDGEPAYSASERVLIAMRHLEWARSSDILIALDVGDEHTRDTVQSALSHHVRNGKVLRRGDRISNFTYQLNEAAFAPASQFARCTRGNCTQAPEPGRRMCKEHGEYMRASNASYKARTRRAA